MTNRVRCFCVAALLTLGASPGTAAHRAAVATFFAWDQPGTVLPLHIPNAQAARTSFLEGLAMSHDEGFEAYATGTTLFTTVGGVVQVFDDRIVPRPVTGTKFLGWNAGSAVDAFAWTVPASNAFGFYGVDIGDGSNEKLGLRLHLVDGGVVNADVPHARGTPASDAVFFYGIVVDQPFDRIEFVTDGTATDFSFPGLGFDDFVAGARAVTVVPEPGPGVLILCGVLLCAAAVRGRLRQRSADQARGLGDLKDPAGT